MPPSPDKYSSQFFGKFHYQIKNSHLYFTFIAIYSNDSFIAKRYEPGYDKHKNGFCYFVSKQQVLRLLKKSFYFHLSNIELHDF